MTKTGEDIIHAASVLQHGGLVAIPTETVYGLAANALDAFAVLRIFEAKQRPQFDPLIVHSNSIDRLRPLLGPLTDDAEKLAAAFWPGPLTLVLPKGPDIPDLVTSGLSTVAVRVPRHPLTLALLSKLNFPLAAPSANPFGYVSPTTASHVEAQLGRQVEYILDGGPCEVGVESTIVACDTGIPCVLRLGGTPLEAIEVCLGKKINVAEQSTSNPAAPGMLLSHYATSKTILLGDVAQLTATLAEGSFAVLGFTHTFGFPGIALSPSGNLREAAQNLFAAMRALDETDFALIVAEHVPAEGLGMAINDRLTRAAHQRMRP